MFVVYLIVAAMFPLNLFSGSARNTMKINSIKIDKLFEIFDYTISFENGENLLIITGPNGFGKTMILNIIFSLFNRKFTFFQKLVFKKIVIFMEDPDPLNLSNGHDFMNALSKYLNDHGDGKKISKETIQRISRAVYSFENFTTTNLHQKLSAWADSKDCRLFA